MKTLILTIAILFSFTTVNAQNETSTTDISTEIENAQDSKISFYKVLVTKNNLNITNENNDTVITTKNKVDFYNVLVSKIGLNTNDDMDLAEINTMEAGTTNVAFGLLP